MTLYTLISTSISNMLRIIKVNGMGKNDPRTATEVAPYGDDSNPIPGTTVIYAPTGNNSERVVIGSVNTKQMAAYGEKRLYATNTAGDVQCYIWLHNDGKIEVIRGNSKLTVTDSGFKIEANGKDFGTVMQTFCTKLEAATLAVSGSSGTFSPTTVADITNIAADLAQILV